MTFTLSTHILDLERGAPAVNVAVTLRQAGSAQVLAQGTTDDDGRIGDWPDFECGEYELCFEIGAWSAKQRRDSFYPRATVHFDASQSRHYHVPLLLNRYGYSTYRGS